MTGLIKALQHAAATDMGCDCLTDHEAEVLAKVALKWCADELEEQAERCADDYEDAAAYYTAEAWLRSFR